MRNRILVSLLILLLPLFSGRAQGQDGNTYVTANRLFHIARSANRNLVCYDVNATDGKLNRKNPIHVYWINREEHPGEKGELNYVQRKFAYGYKVVKTDDHTCLFTLTAYPKRQFVLSRYQGGFACFVTINKQKALLQSLYVKANPRNPLKVEYVELHGTSLATHRPVTERVKK